MNEISIQLAIDLVRAPFPRERYERLVRKLFASRPGVQAVTITELPGGHSGLSSLAILLALPTGAGGSGKNPLLIRIGPQAAIREENRRYETYVGPALGPQHARLAGVTEDEDLAIVAYDYLRLVASNQPLETLRQAIAHTSQLDAICQAIRSLFRDTLTQGGHLNSGWYINQPTPDQRPLWYYNTLLPPTLTLAFVGATQQEPAGLRALLARADRPGSELLIGQQVVIGAGGGYSQLRVVERTRAGDGWRLRLQLYEQAPPEEHTFQPLPQVAARLDLLLPPQPADALPANLEAALRGECATITGAFVAQIVEARQQRLTTIVRDKLGQVAGRRPDGRIAVGDLWDPLESTCRHASLSIL